ncbi:MAG: AmmeMemoRadiSam system protein B [Deltaproteobacteria bacterium]|nr:AmmeMemoRadiSam system protein B [Deltaproteobacteria bacterium]MBW2305431.1 AmmeMemoRadiSam system protein B [Deltaproteobacteria bacterium]
MNFFDMHLRIGYKKSTMDTLPRHRPMNPIPVEVSGKHYICLQDPLRLTEKTAYLPMPVYFIYALLDGEHSLTDIQAAYMRQFGELIFTDKMRQIIEALDENLLLDSPRFREHMDRTAREFRSLKVRPASHAGVSYEMDTEKLLAQLKTFFTGPGGPGLPREINGSGRVVAAIAPHYDIRGGGGPFFALVYKALAEECATDLFIILGTAHTQTRNLFVLTALDFETPLGTVKTDAELLRKLQEVMGKDLREDELNHRTEHSVEFQVLFLQFALGGKRDFTILPVLCGSFHEMEQMGRAPEEVPEFGMFIDALKQAVEATGRRPCYIASADLSHVGVRFGDGPLSSAFLQKVEAQDRDILNYAARKDTAALFQWLCENGDRYRVCGFPCIYTLVSALNEGEGELLRYGQQQDPGGESVVSFASMIFRRSE